MSWKERILAPIGGVFGGMLVAVTIWLTFFDVSVSTSGSFLHKVKENLVANVEVTVVVATVGGAVGLLIGIFIAIFGGRS